MVWYYLDTANCEDLLFQTGKKGRQRDDPTNVASCRIGSLTLGALAVSSSLSRPAVADGALVVNSYGGSFEEFMRGEIVPPFAEQSGAEITLDVNLGKGWLANLRAAGVDNAPYDVLMTNETWASIEREEGFFEPINVAKLSNVDDLWPIARLPDDNGVIGTLSPIGIAYRTDLVESPPKPGPISGPTRSSKGKPASTPSPTPPAT